MNPSLETTRTSGARKLVEHCADVGPNDRVLALTDDSTRPVGALVAEVAAARTETVEHVTMPVPRVHGEEPPAHVAEAMRAATVVFCLTSRSLAHTRARQLAGNGGTRFLSLPDYDLDLLASPSLGIDFTACVGPVDWIGDRIDAATTIRVRSDLGTDLELDITGRRANRCPGLCRVPGSLASPPDAEVNVPPLETGSNGILVVDGSVPCPQVGRLDEPITLTIEDGQVVRFDGRPDVVRALNELFDAAGERSRVVAEFGIGLNPRAELTGRMLEDEGCGRCVHFGIGSNATIGGLNVAGIHLDFVTRDTTVTVGDELVLERGTFVPPLLAACPDFAALVAAAIAH